MKTTLIILALSVTLSAQTTVYMRASGPASTYVTGASANGVTPFHLIVNSTAGLAGGDLISVAAVCANDGVNYISVANGIRKIASVNRGTDLTITDQAGGALTSNGDWCTGGLASAGGVNGGNEVGKLTAFTLGSAPRGWFDGPTGTTTRQFALGTANGLYQSGGTGGLVCNGTICTVTTTYAHGVQAGYHITVWGTTSSTLNNGRAMTADYVVNSSGLTTTAFTFNSSVSAGDYTTNAHCGPGATPNGTIQGTDNCVRISQLATQNSNVWPSIWNNNTASYITSNIYKSLIDDPAGGLGGGAGSEAVVANYWTPIAMLSLVDVSHTGARAAVQYMMLNVERLGGAGFYTEERAGEGGNSEIGDFGSYVWRWLSFVYQAGAPYLTPTQKTLFLSKIYADISDPTPCTKNLYANKVLATGTAAGGSTTTITLAADPGHGDNYYNNNVIVSQMTQLQVYSVVGMISVGDTVTQGGATGTIISWTGYWMTVMQSAGTFAPGSLTDSTSGATGIILSPVGTVNVLGAITGYVASTKVATVSSWSILGWPGTAIAPTGHNTYTIYATISRVGTTITGYNTTFIADVAYGDVLYGANNWVGEINQPTMMGSYVTSNPPVSDTSLTVINGAYPNVGATPKLFYLAKHQTSTAQCGFKWSQNHWAGSFQSQPISYPTTGGGQSSYGGLITASGSNNASTFDAGRASLDLVTADDEPRAITDLAQVSAHWWDYEMAFAMTYTGVEHSGSHYSWARWLQDVPIVGLEFMRSVVGFPSLDPTGPWVTAPSTFKVFSALPDTPYSALGGPAHTQFAGEFGQIAGDAIWPGGQAGPNWISDSGLKFAPSSLSSQYLSNWFTAHSAWAWAHGLVVAETALLYNPNAPSSAYTAQPHQYLFGGSSGTSYAVCQTLFGGTCPYPQTMRGDGFISRTGWSSASDAFLFVQARTYTGDHDGPQPGTLQLYQNGFLLGNDTTVVGGSDPDSTSGLYDPTKNDVAFEFGGTNTLLQNLVGHGSMMTTNITRWSSANSGSWPAAYGDQNSNYACAMIDFSGAYTTAYAAAQRTICDFKKPGTEHVIVQYDYVDATGHATAIRNQVHYTQNGELVAAHPWNYYDEGSTTCPGSGGCSSLNANRVVLESQTGVADGHGDPTPQYNLISNFLVPSGAPNLFIHYDGSTYPGTNSHTNRVSLCADASSTGACGAAGQSKLEDLIVHKIATRPDTTLTTTALNPDANWAGAQMTGATDTKVFLAARRGQLQSTLTTFTPAFSGTAQWLISGLAPGTYTVTVGGNTVVNGKTVSNGDNSLYFESPAGAVTISQGGMACSISTATLLAGVAGTPYSTTLLTAGCAIPISWSITAGSLCNGLSLGASTGIISGTPSPAQTCSFTVQATDNGGNTASQALNLVVLPSAGASYSGGTISAGTVRH
jgi:hypothetical protein